MLIFGLIFGGVCLLGASAIRIVLMNRTDRVRERGYFPVYYLLMLLSILCLGAGVVFGVAGY